MQALAEGAGQESRQQGGPQAEPGLGSHQVLIVQHTHLLFCVSRTFGPYYAFLGIFTAVEEIGIRILQPLFMGGWRRYSLKVIQTSKSKTIPI